MLHIFSKRPLVVNNNYYCSTIITYKHLHFEHFVAFVHACGEHGALGRHIAIAVQLSKKEIVGGGGSGGAARLDLA